MQDKPMHRLAAAVFFLGALAPLPATAAVGWDLTSGIDFSAGRYGGAADTSVTSVPLALRVQMDKFRAELTIPYLSVKSPGTFTGGGVVGAGASVTHYGLGDITLGGAWQLHADEVNWPALEIAGSVKFPTAASSLGTGQFDYSLQANVNHFITPRVMLFGSAGYQWLHDFSIYKLESGVSASAGLNVRASDSTYVGFSTSFREPYAPGVGNQYTLAPFALWSFASNWRATAYFVKGFSRASPRIGGGLRLTYFR
jgi:hypothetical protein